MRRQIVNTANKVVIPDRILIPFVTDIHEAYGHVGAYKTFKTINESLFAPKMLKRIKKILKPCEICQRSKHLTIRYDEILQPILVNKPNEILSIDFYGPLPTSVGGVKYILTTIDVFSKYVVIYKIKKANTLAVINKIFKDYIIRFGKPVAIMTDHGTQFTSENRC